MTRRTYTLEYKAKLVIEVLQGEKELNTIAAVCAAAHPAVQGLLQTRRTIRGRAAAPGVHHGQD